VRASLRLLGVTARLGMGPTALGARLLADAPPPGAGPVRGGQVSPRRRVVRLERLTAVLDALPVGLLAAARAHHDWLQGIGCSTLGELRRLPRAGLQRRSSKLLLDELDRAYGQAPELHDWVAVPPVFAAYAELPYRTEQSDAILLSANGLLLQMIGWLVAQQLAVTRLQFSMEHERGRTAVPPTLLEIVLSEPAWQEAHLLRLLKERLERMALVAPVIALRLQALQLQPLAPPTASLFPEPGGTPADYHRLLELLVARLGEDAVLTPAPLADHRPEICNRWQPATRASAPRERAGAGLPASDQVLKTERPFWLLAQPLALLVREHRPFYGSALRLVSAPERIESGWWDGNFVARDYFIAIGAESACYWVYRERAGDEVRWFLHGLFA
jgi:protein ImuB